MLIRATSTIPAAPNWNATCPPTVSRPCAGPLKAMAAALCWVAAAVWSRAAWVGNKPLMPTTVRAASATIGTIQMRIRMRSRRRMKRVRATVP